MVGVGHYLPGIVCDEVWSVFGGNGYRQVVWVFWSVGSSEAGMVIVAMVITTTISESLWLII